MAEDPARNRLRAMLSELLDHMEGAQEVANGIAQDYPEYEAMAEAVVNASDMVAMACELEAYDERESDDYEALSKAFRAAEPMLAPPGPLGIYKSPKWF